MKELRITVYGPKQGFYVSFLHDWHKLDYAVGHAGVVRVPEGESEPGPILSRIFVDGNGEGGGAGFTVAGRSMSAGDVVHLDGYGVWLCAAVGWIPITGPDALRFPLVDPEQRTEEPGGV